MSVCSFFQAVFGVSLFFKTLIWTLAESPTGTPNQFDLFWNPCSVTKGSSHGKETETLGTSTTWHFPRKSLESECVK